MGIDCSCNRVSNGKNLDPELLENTRSKQSIIRSSREHRDPEISDTETHNKATFVPGLGVNIHIKTEKDNIARNTLFRKRLSTEETELVSDNERIQAIISTPTLLKLQDAILTV